MTVSNRGAKTRSAIRNVRNNGPLPEDIGNKKSFDEVRVPPDDVGNKIEAETALAYAHDNIGNSLDEMPAHLKSGILSQLAVKKNNNRTSPRRNGYNPGREQHTTHSEMPPSRHTQGLPIEAMGAKVAALFRSENYMENLIAEFAKLLKNKSGQPFSFLMNASRDVAPDALVVEETLDSFRDLIEVVLSANEITADVDMTQYQSAEHQVAVFFINPSEEDPLKNKELISALRQTLSPSAKFVSQSGVNVFLALRNAQAVIDEHLLSLGAKKKD